ncbi:DinB family protein [Flavobacterium sp.]|uniref:DinB family protein n=1 Tax=Flavobacterium sp. TaxID=239 RepID=UPI00374FE770
MNASQLKSNEYGEWYKPYIATLNEEILIEELEIALHRFIRFVQDIPIEKHDYAYAEGKWTIKDIIQHLIDCERIFSYRALCFARNDKTFLPGFEENDYANEAKGKNRSLISLLTELAAVRQATLLLFKDFTEDELLRLGTASNNSMSVRAVGFIIIGHQNHHQKIFEDRYL